MNTRQEVIKSKLASLQGNMLGGTRISIQNLAKHMKYPIIEVRAIVQDMVAEGDLMFERRSVTPRDSSYDREYLEVVKKKKTHRKAW